MKLYWIVAQEEYINAEEIEKLYSEYKFEFKIRNIEFSFLKLEDCIVNNHPVDGLNLKCKDIPLSENTSAFIISPANLNAQARAVSSSLRNYLHSRGANILNDSIFGIENLEWDKISQMTLASGVGAPVLPFTMLGYHRQVVPAVEAFAKYCQGEFIFKPTGASMGFAGLTE